VGSAICSSFGTVPGAGAARGDARPGATGQVRGISRIS